jgi:hypothetical protein
VAREVLERDGRWTDDLERMRAKQSPHPTNAQPTLRLAS